jgi:alkaline phosphatase D
MTHRISRRKLIGSIGALSTAATLPLWATQAPAFLRGRLDDPLPSDVFSLGVGSGDADEDSVVLWTRLAPDPLNGGGMPQRPVRVRYRLAHDPGMGRVFRMGEVWAVPDTGHVVQVQVAGLRPDSWYWFDFEVQGARSRVGRTRTFSAARQHCPNLRFALVSCQDYEAGYYPAYRDMLTQQLDFVVHVGDYIYESGASASPLILTRTHLGAEIFSVQDYRNRYALYRLDPNLQNVHAQLPFFCVWDDHEVDNNYADEQPEASAPYQGVAFLQRRRNAYQVYLESMPLRRRSDASGEHRERRDEDEVRIYRNFQFGDLANLYLLDTRQYRSDQPAGDGFGSTDVDALAIEPVLGESLYDAAGILNPSATLLGPEQERWLGRNLRESDTRWNILGQQIMVMPWNLIKAGRKQVELNPSLPAAQKAALLGAFDRVADLYNVDAWDGYPAARRRLLSLIRASGALNPVILSGDIHSAWAANLVTDFGDVANADLIAAEFVCTSITSTFLSPDPRPTDFVVRTTLTDNPHIHYFNGLFRGYSLCDVNHQRWQTTYRTVLGDPRSPDPLALIPQANSPVGTDRVLQIESGFNVPGAALRITG